MFTSPSPCGILSGLKLRSSAGCHSLCKFLCTLLGSGWHSFGDIHTLWFLKTFCTLFCSTPWAVWERFAKDIPQSTKCSRVSLPEPCGRDLLRNPTEHWVLSSLSEHVIPHCSWFAVPIRNKIVNFLYANQLFLKIYSTLIMCICVCSCRIWGCVKTGTHRNKKRALDPPELKLKAVFSCLTWVLGTDPLQEKSMQYTESLQTSINHLYILFREIYI